MLASQDVAIAIALKEGTLKIVETFSERFQETYFFVEDDRGIIEVCDTRQEAEDRIDYIKAKAAQ